MSKLSLKKYSTRLESAETVEELHSILDLKIESSTPQGVADYIALGIDNIDATVARMKELKKELDFRIKLAEKQKAIVKVGCTQWLENAGIDKLDGDIISSVSIYTPKPKETLKIINEESLINQGYFKTVVDKTMVKNAIKDDVNVDGAEIEVVYEENTLKVNKRRVTANSIKAEEKISA